MEETGRKYWVNTLVRIAHPVLSASAVGQLKRLMPIESKIDRSRVTHLEAVARLLAGMAPWLELRSSETEEEGLREAYAERARQAIDSITRPDSPDYVDVLSCGTVYAQPLVDAAFLAHAIVRAPNELWHKLASTVKQNVVIALKRTRRIQPCWNNWLLFSAMIEVALLTIGDDYDVMRIDYAIRQHEQWYKGDGTYGDGPEFHWDYYNSFVIQPILLDIVRHVVSALPHYSIGESRLNSVLSRARRFATVQEMLISPEGTFPAFGRSITYRCGAFHLLAQMAMLKQLPQEVSPPQVRCALEAVIKRCLEVPGTFDDNGWLRIGLCGSQPTLGEPYISTGSLYLCSTAFLPLGIPSHDEFWSGQTHHGLHKKYGPVWITQLTTLYRTSPERPKGLIDDSLILWDVEMLISNREGYEMFSIDGPLYKLLSISYKFVVLNIVFLISCIPIITIPISTVGIFVVARKIIDREDYSVLREFWYGVRQNWKQGLLAGGLFFIILCSVEMDLHMSIGIHSSLSVIAMYMILLISCIGILHIYPLIVYTKSTVKGLLLNAFKLILYRPWLTFFNVVILNVMFFVCMKFPILFFALFFSLSAIATNWFVRRKIQSLTFQEE